MARRRRKIYKRKRRTRKRTRKRRRRGSAARPKITRIARLTQGPPLQNTNPVGPTYQAFAFSLNMLPNYSEFSALFRYYKIDKVVTTFVPNTTNVQYNSAGAIDAHQSPVIFSRLVPDLVSSTSLNTFYEDPHTRRHNPMGTFKRIVSPMVQTEVYKSAAFTTYSPKKLWMQTSDPSVPWSGFETVMDNVDPAYQRWKFSTYHKFFVSFKGIK